MTIQNYNPETGTLEFYIGTTVYRGFIDPESKIIILNDTKGLEADIEDVYKRQDQYTTKYYSPDCSTLTSRDENTAIVLEDAYGVAASSIPDPTVFLTAFGDNISGPCLLYTSIFIE